MASGGGQAAPAKSSSSLQIDLDAFGRRLRLLFDSWRKSNEESEGGGFWHGVHVWAVATPLPTEDMRYLKSSSLQIWLLGYEFPETVFVLVQPQGEDAESGKGELHVICSSKKASHLEAVKAVCEQKSGGITMHLHPKAKSEDGSVQMGRVLERAKEVAEAASATAGKSARIGILPKEPIEGPLMTKWMDMIGSSGLETVDVASALGDVLAVKDEGEVVNVKKAAFLSAQALKAFVVPKMEVLIDEEKSMTHAELMDKTEEVVTEPSKIKVKLKPENCDVCYPPVFQSGGQYDLKVSASSSDEPLCYESMGAILCSIGARYSSYCSNVSRTYLIDATPAQETAYKLLLKTQEAAIAAIKPGVRLCDVYAAAVAVVREEAPDLLPKLTKHAGAAIGIEFRDASLMLNAKNERPIRTGMTFNVSLGFHDLPNDAPGASDNPKLRSYSLLLADTVVVRAAADKDKWVDVATASASKAFSDVAYTLKGDDDDEDEEEEEKRTRGGASEPVMSRASLRSETQEATKEELRRQHQAELAKQKIEETARRLAAGGLGATGGQGVKKTMGDLVSYTSVDDVPVPIREIAIQVDQKHESVLIPIYGLLVPFHVSMIKNVTTQQDGGHVIVRVIFNVPGAGFSAADLPVQKFANAIYLREVSFRSTDSRHATQMVQLMKTMSKSVRQRESERAERATLVTQEKLILAKGRPARLPDLWIRPSFGGKGRKLTGSLEAHTNGFRYSTPKPDERLDVMYNNIKHAFFQPAENEMITLLHFHLHNPIMVGNKKTRDVQFYAEVMEVVQTVGGSRRSAYDPDEIEEEQRERERKNKINREFKAFVAATQAQWEKDKDLARLDLEFDIPFRDLGFHGVPHKSSAFIVPTVNCLVELVEMPFFVVTLNEVEIVNLERVGLGQKTFDMAIVFKDYRREVVRIDAIPSTSLDSVKEWLNSMNIKYYESRLNLSWKAILQNILENPAQFLEQGGWEFLNLEASDDEGSASEESQAYEPSDIEEASDEEEEAEEDDESVVDSEEDEGEEEEEEEEEGPTWDELEEKALREDREKGEEVDSDDERRRRRSKGGGPPMSGGTRPMSGGMKPGSSSKPGFASGKPGGSGMRPGLTPGKSGGSGVKPGFGSGSKPMGGSSSKPMGSGGSRPTGNGGGRPMGGGGSRPAGAAFQKRPQPFSGGMAKRPKY